MSLLVYVSDVAPYSTARGRSPAGVHRSLNTAAVALQQLAGMCDLEFHHVQRVQDLGDDLMAQARVLALFTIGETAWAEAQRREIETCATTGRLGLLALHSTTDSAYQWPFFGRIVGGRFDGHPVTGVLPLSVVDRAHPATAHLPSPWMFKEELYLFRDLVPEAQVLIGVRFNDLSVREQEAVTAHLARPAPAQAPELLPMAWCLDQHGMRSFYTALGHFLSAYEDTLYMRHLAGALQWLLATDKMNTTREQQQEGEDGV
jgi:type 1 glutamine amidotransferase